MGKPPAVTPDGAFALSGADKESQPSFGRYLSAGEKVFYEKTGFSPSACPPVSVVLHSAGESASSLPSLNVDAIEGGAPRVSLHIRAGEHGIETTQLLVAALMLREFYGDRSPVAGSRVPHFPPWIVRGLATLCFPPGETVRIPSSYLKGGAPPTLEDFLTQRPPDPSNPSLSDLYDVTSSLLMNAGLGTTTGQEAFRKWIGHDESKGGGGDRPRWIAGWEMKPIERRWLLLMAGNSSEGEGVSRLQGMSQSLKDYDAVMAEGLSGGTTISALARDKKAGAYRLGTISDRLKRCRLRTNPLVIPLIDRTLILIEKAPKLSVKKLNAEEKEIGELRASMLRQSGEIEAYLDWYEATRLPVRSGYFDRLLKNPDPGIRKGPIGRHMDAVEERGW